MIVVHQVLDGSVAGGQLVALALARAAREQGNEVSFVSPSDGPFLDRVRAEGFDAVVVPLRHSYRLDDALALAGVLRRLDADVLHQHGHFVVNLLGRVAARLARVPVVAHVHAESRYRGNGFVARLQAAADNTSARGCARILVVSEATRSRLAAQGHPAGRLEVVPNGVDLERADIGDVRASLGVADDERLLVHVGRLAPQKGQRELLEAVGRLPPDVRVALVGEDVEFQGAFRAELEAAADGRAIFTGYRADARAIIAAADIFVLPSWIEGQPLVVLEAMAEARPIVATAVGGIPELVEDGISGVLVPARNAPALAAALADLLTDAPRARALGVAARRRAEERFSIASSAARVLAVYAEIGS
jgi:glycosyltransferase involved in cell wall biosynthesis